MFKFDRNNKEYVCNEAQINVNEVAFVCTPTKNINKGMNNMKSYENFENNNSPFSYLPLAESEKDVGSSPQQSYVKGETKFGVVAGKKAAIFNNKLETFIALANKTNGTFTVMFWIYKNDGGYYTAVSITDGNNPLLQFDVNSDRQIAFSALPNPWVHDGWSKTAVAPGAWYHVAYTVSGNEGTLYINGNRDNSFRGGGPMNSAARPLWYIGRSGDNGRAFHGAIRQFAVWNSVVDENTIRAFMKKTEHDVDTNGIVKFVRVDGGNDYLQLSQVVVTDANGSNIAKGKKTSSSGAGWDTQESTAVDGVEASRGHPSEFVSTGGNAFYQIELSSPSQVASVTIYNRADCCQDRLATGYRVKLLDSQGNVVFTSNPLNNSAKQVIQITGPAGSKPEPPVFRKIDCEKGLDQVGFSCYPQWLINQAGASVVKSSQNGNNVAQLLCLSELSSPDRNPNSPGVLMTMNGTDWFAPKIPGNKNKRNAKIAKLNDTYYMGVMYEKQMFYSSKDARNWQPAGPNNSDFIDVSCMGVIAFKNKLYVAIYDRGLFSSSDGINFTKHDIYTSHLMDMKIINDKLYFINRYKVSEFNETTNTSKEISPMFHAGGNSSINHVEYDSKTKTYLAICSTPDQGDPQAPLFHWSNDLVNWNKSTGKWRTGKYSGFHNLTNAFGKWWANGHDASLLVCSEDGGKTWNEVKSPVNSHGSLFKMGALLFYMGIDDPSNQFFSTKDGNNWEKFVGANGVANGGAYWKVSILMGGFEDSYEFIQGMDSGGNDIRQSGNADKINELKKECDADPNCKGFNTNGWLKAVVKPKDQWYKWTGEANKGFYLKK
jgi:hypothetical protein